jgi:biopolymer transport protein ExbB
MDIRNALAALTHLGATWVLWLLIGLSVVCLALIAERIVCYLTTGNGAKELPAQLGALAKEREWSRLEKLLSESPSYEARVASAGFTGDPAGAHGRMEVAARGARLELEKNLAVLGTVGANAPFVGLLGTVIGIIGAFGELERTQGMLSGALMSEIGEALLATAVGLIVALPAVTAFNLFRRVVQRRLVQLQATQDAVAGLLPALAQEARDGE